MTYLAVCLLCMLGIEILMLLPFRQHLATLGRVSQKSARVISSSKISDHWKERALQRYARDMFLASLTIGALLLVLAVVASGAAWLLDLALSPTVPSLEYFMTLPGLLLATVFSTMYVFGRKRLLSMAGK